MNAMNPRIMHEYMHEFMHDSWIHEKIIDYFFPTLIFDINSIHHLLLFKYRV